MKKMSKAKIILIICAISFLIYTLYQLITYFIQPNGLELIRKNSFELSSNIIAGVAITYVASLID